MAPNMMQVAHSVKSSFPSPNKAVPDGNTASSFYYSQKKALEQTLLPHSFDKLLLKVNGLPKVATIFINGAD